MSSDALILKRAENIKSLLEAFSDDIGKVDGLMAMATDFVDVYDGFRLAQIKLQGMMQKHCYEHGCPIQAGALGCPTCARGGTPRPKSSG